MDHTRCNVVYLDRRAQKNAVWKRDDIKHITRTEGSDRATQQEQEAVEHNVRAILATFEEGMYISQSVPKSPTDPGSQCL